MKRFTGSAKTAVSSKKVGTKKGLKKSSANWLQRHINDPYVQQAKIEGYRSRSAYKLLEIDDKFAVIESFGNIVDLGAAPGGWSQVAMQRRNEEGTSENKKVIAVDLLEMEPLQGVQTVMGDFNESETKEQISELLPEKNKKVSLVMSDLAANTTGHAPTDHLKSMQLAEEAFNFSLDVLSKGGHFITKIFTGGSEREFTSKLKNYFKNVSFFKPSSSRSHSSEIYLVAKKFIGGKNGI
jgi:23S rRNA (uridine2552-2'-O)-methyltransferase